MQTLTFDSFTKKIYIKTTVEILYALWATKAGIESWFLRRAQYSQPDGNARKDSDLIQVGDTYIWEWYNWNGQEKGTILQANGNDFLEFSFAEVSKVSISLEEKKDAVLLTLRQYEIPTDEKSKMNIFNGCSCGWTFWLANLKAFLEHGILLNEKDFDLTEVPDSGHVFVNM